MKSPARKVIIRDEQVPTRKKLSGAQLILELCTYDFCLFIP